MPFESTTDLSQDERITSFGLMIEAYARLQGVFARTLKDECDITIAVFELLLRLVRSNDQKLSMTDLAEQLAITGGGTTRLVDRAINAGFVERKPCPTDRRVQWVTLTAAGRNKVEAATAVHLDDLQRELFDRLTSTDSRQLSTIMDKLRRTE